LAQSVCGTCHLFPEPDIADRFSWANVILPRMTPWLGYPTVDWASEPGGNQVLESGKMPTAPVVDLAALKTVYNYYLSTAPLAPLTQSPKPEIQVGLKGFRLRKSSYRSTNANTTLVKIDERSRSLLIADAAAQKLVILRSNGTLAASLEMPQPIVHLAERSDGFLATIIGSVTPSDVAQGSLRRLRAPVANFPGNPAAFDFAETMLSELRRPVDAAVADLNQDGRDDLVVATFGNILGRFSWFEQQADRRYEEHSLLDRPGAVSVRIHDFNKDGRPDILVLMAQGQEGISLMVNLGQGQFEERVITKQHPAWGFSHLELVDFNRDGEMDLLVTNGDNGESTSFANGLKPYHGVRLYMNQGGGRFVEAWFYPMHGAYRALARDFDLDGDLDIAAIAYFPDYMGGTKESFVYLENRTDRGEVLRFSASTFPQSLAGRWITMDAGDLDGDGDADIALGASNRSFADVPRALAETWAIGPCFLFLENTAR
jgi:hypothetical protein